MTTKEEATSTFAYKIWLARLPPARTGFEDSDTLAAEKARERQERSLNKRRNEQEE